MHFLELNHQFCRPKLIKVSDEEWALTISIDEKKLLPVLRSCPVIVSLNEDGFVQVSLTITLSDMELNEEDLVKLLLHGTVTLIEANG